MMRQSATVPRRQRPITSESSSRSAVRSAILRSTSTRCWRAIVFADLIEREAKVAGSPDKAQAPKLHVIV
jgi:hypothetical protein